MLLVHICKEVVVEENGVFAESRLCGMVNIRKQTALYWFSRNGVKPRRTRRFNYYRAEETVYVCTLLVTSCVRHIREEINTLLVRLPNIDN